MIFKIRDDDIQELKAFCEIACEMLSYEDLQCTLRVTHLGCRIYSHEHDGKWIIGFFMSPGDGSDVIAEDDPPQYRKIGVTELLTVLLSPNVSGIAIAFLSDDDHDPPSISFIATMNGCALTFSHPAQVSSYASLDIDKIRSETNEQGTAFTLTPDQFMGLYYFDHINRSPTISITLETGRLVARGQRNGQPCEFSVASPVFAPEHTVTIGGVYDRDWTSCMCVINKKHAVSARISPNFWALTSDNTFVAICGIGHSFTSQRPR